MSVKCEQESNSKNIGQKSFFENTVKIISKDKAFSDKIIQYLKLAFDAQPTSPLMYSSEKDAFYIFVGISKRSV